MAYTGYDMPTGQQPKGPLRTSPRGGMENRGGQGDFGDFLTFLRGFAPFVALGSLGWGLNALGTAAAGTTAGTATAAGTGTSAIPGGLFMSANGTTPLFAGTLGSVGTSAAGTGLLSGLGNFLSSPAGRVAGGLLGSAGLGLLGNSGMENARRPGTGYPQGPLTDVGLTNLMDILLGRGATDPRTLNTQLSDIARSTQSQQQDVRDELASRGLQDSGVGQAVQAAVGAAGAGQRRRAISEEVQLAEQRRRQDLQLLLSLFIQPSLDAQAIATGQYNAAQSRDAAREGATYGAIANLIGGLLGD